MSVRDPKTGRFVRADEKPVLHRQVADDSAAPSYRVIRDGQPLDVPVWQSDNGGPWYSPNRPGEPAPDWLPRPDPHGPRIELRSVVIGVLLKALFLAAIGAVFMGLAWLASPGGPGQ